MIFLFILISRIAMTMTHSLFSVWFEIWFSYIHYSCVLDPGDKIVDCPPTFTMYEFDAAVNGALVIKGKNNIP